jgi:hypothetical protein
MEEVKPYRVIPINDSPGLKKQEERGFAREAALSFPGCRTDFSSPYRLAPQLKAAAEPIIARYHPHLRQAAIAYLLRRGTWKSRGQVITGKAAIAPEQWRLLSGCDLLLIINETVWQVLGDKGREVLLDHELSHFTPPTAGKDGSLHWAIREHDLQEFSEVVKRHGVCTGDHRRLIEAAGQLDLVSLGALTDQEEGESIGGADDGMDDADGFTEGDSFFGGPQ